MVLVLRTQRQFYCQTAEEEVVSSVPQMKSKVLKITEGKVLPSDLTIKMVKLFSVPG